MIIVLRPWTVGGRVKMPVLWQRDHRKAEGGGQEVGKCRECWFSQSLEISFGEWLLLQEVNSCSLSRNDLGLGSY